jgi:hypothetical protein
MASTSTRSRSQPSSDLTGVSYHSSHVLGTDLSPSTNRVRFFAIGRMIAQAGVLIAPVAYTYLTQHVS